MVRTPALIQGRYCAARRFDGGGGEFQTRPLHLLDSLRLDSYHSFENTCRDDLQRLLGYVISAKAGIQANSTGNKPGFPRARE